MTFRVRRVPRVIEETNPRKDTRFRFTTSLGEHQTSTKAAECPPNMFERRVCKRAVAY